MIKGIINFFKSIIRNTQLGFYYLCLLITKGFFFYFYIIVSIFEKIFKLKVFTKLKNFFKNRQSDPVAFLMLVLFFLVGVFLYTYLYDDEEIKFVDDSILETKEVSEKPVNIESDKETYKDNEINLFRKYAKMNINEVDFNELKNTNSEVVAWIMVDGTNINYPIVQGSDNDYYLNHDIVKNPKASGWPFMDYRNSSDMSNDNTIFYGHNLLNKTAFGSIANIFTNNWFKSSNHLIIVRTPEAKYVYEIFSCYYIDPEVYYLQESFYDDNERLNFYNKLKGRSQYNFNINLEATDKIITLSTCTDDNKGRKVIHAKLKK